MKRFLTLLALFCYLSCACVSAQSKAPATLFEQQEKYQQAGLLYLTANACLASYNDRVGNIFYTFLQHDGWRSQRIKQSGQIADANLFIASRLDEVTGKTTYILALRGTASKKDLKLDKRTRRVLFAGSSIGELSENAGKAETTDAQPRVHRGFLQYTLAALAVDVEDESRVAQSKRFYELLKEDSGSKLIITGHSLGGAAAVLYAASLINFGIEPERIQLVTYGAPAVGNEAFAQAYKDNIKLLRVYSTLDPIPGGLQSLFHNYVQFGSLFAVQSDPHLRILQHSMENYADMMGKHYYNCKQAAIDEGIIPQDPMQSDAGTGKTIAVALLPPEDVYSLPDSKYAVANLLDTYRWSFPRYRILTVADTGASKQELTELARRSGADVLLTARIGISRVKTSKYWVVSLDQGLFTTDGDILSGLTHSVRLKEGASIFQASAYNGFKAVEMLGDLDAELIRPLDHLVSE